MSKTGEGIISEDVEDLVNALRARHAATGNKAWKDAATALTAQQAEIERLRGCLRWYQDQFCEGWCFPTSGSFEDCSGCKARAALKGEQDDD